jgi:GNAT superfamily N-acetyltransferase
MYEELTRVAGKGIADKIACRSHAKGGIGAVASQGFCKVQDGKAEITYGLRDGQSWTLFLRKTETYWELMEGTVSSPRKMIIREAVSNDLPVVQRLYAQLHDETPGSEADIATAWQQLCENPALHCFVAEGSMGILLGTCTLVVVPNLTRGARPYGLIENVVTDADNRQQGIGTALVKHALDFAWEQRCYKVMLLTSRTDEAVLRFYEHAGFVRGVKTGFVAKPPDV